MFTPKEKAFLAALALLAALSYLTGFDYYLARTLSQRTPHGISLFFSYQYYVAYMVLGTVILYLRNRRAAASLLVSVAMVFLIQFAFTEIAPRPRPPEAMPIGDGLLSFIRHTGGMSSFYSGHTGSSIALATTYMLVGMQPALAFVLAFPIILSRLLLVQHYLSDVLAGIIAGYVFAKAVYAAFTAKSPGASA